MSPTIAPSRNIWVQYAGPPMPSSAQPKVTSPVGGWRAKGDNGVECSVAPPTGSTSPARSKRSSTLCTAIEAANAAITPNGDHQAMHTATSTPMGNQRV